MPIELPGAMPSRLSTTRDSAAGAQVTRGPQAAVTTAETEEAKTAADHVTLSGTAAQMHSIASVVAAAPAVDLQHVQNVKREVDSGTYRINAKQVADKFVTLEKQLYQSLAA